MQIEFIAGFGPVTRTPAEGLGFWSESLPITYEEVGPDYYHAKGLDGAKVFALWPLTQAAEATFGTADWPTSTPVPQGWIEFEMASPEAVREGEEELTAGGHQILAATHEEPWGQTTCRLQSPEGLLVGLSYLPSFHA